MYITNNKEENVYLLHISIKKEIPEKINKMDFLNFEDNIHLKTLRKLFDLLRESNILLNEWNLLPNNYLYGFVNGEVVLRVEKIYKEL